MSKICELYTKFLGSMPHVAKELELDALEKKDFEEAYGAGVVIDADVLKRLFVDHANTAMRKLHVKQEHALRYDDPMSMVLLAWRMCVVADSTPVPDDAAFNITTAMTIAAAREYGGVKLARALAPSCGLIDQLVTALSTVAGIYTSQAGVSERIAMLVTSGCWLARTLNEFVPTRAQHAAITTAYIMGRKDTCSEFTGFLARHDPASLVELDECVEELADARRCATNIVATITKGIKEADPAVVDMMGVAMNTQSRMVWWSRLLGQCANAKDVNETNVHITCIDAAVNPCKRNVDLVVHMLVVLPMRDVNLLMHMIAATRAEAVVWDEEEVGPAAASPTPAKKVYKTKRAKLNAKEARQKEARAKGATEEARRRAEELARVDAQLREARLAKMDEERRHYDEALAARAKELTEMEAAGVAAAVRASEEETAAAAVRASEEETAAALGECAVCMEMCPLVVTVPCMHEAVCAACATTWAARSGECPMCREPFIMFLPA